MNPAIPDPYAGIRSAFDGNLVDRSISGSSVISTRSLARSFGRAQALKGVDLEIPEGAIYALVGPNGAGKTTLLKTLLNIIHPSSGSASVLGISSAHVAGDVFTRIGYVSENQELPDWMTVPQLLG